MLKNPDSSRALPKALLFDLGGVVIHLQFGVAMQFWADAAGVPLAQVEARFRLGTPAHTAMETGGSDAVFFTTLQNQLGGNISLDDVVTGWNLILGPEIASVREAIDACLARYPAMRLAVLSNTNATHAAIWRERLASTLSRFEKVYTSHEIGAVKPHTTAFTHVCADLHLQPQEILFFDDTLENVEAARTFGMRAMQITCAADLQKALIAIG